VEAITKVKEVMTPNAKAIWITESLADAAKEMWEICGAGYIHGRKSERCLVQSAMRPAFPE